MKKYILPFALFFLIIAPGCKKGNQGASVVSITGYIRELGTNATIASAVITTYPLNITATTGTTGKFVISSLPFGIYKLNIQRSGYISQTTDFITVAPAGISNLTLYLSKYPATSMVIANAGSDQYSVGYDSAVSLSADASSSYSNTPISYKWVQISGQAITLFSSTSSTPTFTTLPINQLIKIPDTFGLLGIVPTETGTYVLKLYAYANGFSDNTTITITSAAPKPVITNEAGYLFSNESAEKADVPVGSVVYLNGGTHAPAGSSDTITSYLWSFVSAPQSSTAFFDNPLSQTPSFVPDLTGDYIINLTATTSAGKTTQTFTVTANSYIGTKDCETCHNGNVMTDVTTGYQSTGHARAFNALNTVSYVNEDCLKCHTTGFNKSPGAANGGFDDIARDLGWIIALPVSYGTLPSALQTMANVGCESCHGPGSTHTGSYSFNTSVCAQCHDNAPFNPEYSQWLNSPHAQSVLPGGLDLSKSYFSSCRECHWSLNIVHTNMKDEGSVAFVTSDEQPVNCIACHDPHNGANPYSLRFYDTVSIAGDSFTVNGVGEGAVCMKCHTDQKSNPNAAANNRQEPFNTTAEVFAGIAGAGGYAVNLQNSYHAVAGNIRNLCVTCHMAQTPAVGQPGYNTTGEHTFMMSDANGDDHVSVCNTCHTGAYAVSGFNTIDPLYPKANWDSHPAGITEGVQNQIHGLLSVLGCAITTSANRWCTTDTTDINGNSVSWQIFIPSGRGTSYVSLTGTTFAISPTATTQEKNAVYNWYVVNNEGSYGIHNTAFDVMLLQKAFKNLTGSDISGATIR